MVIIFVSMLLALAIFGKTIERRVDTRIEHIYKTGADDDTLKTYLAIHFYDFWMGLASYFCLASAAESFGAALRGNENQLGDYIFGMVAIMTFVICAKITRMFYRASSAREHALAQHIANH